MTLENSNVTQASVACMFLYFWCMVATIIDGVIPTQCNYCLDMSIKELLSRVKAFFMGLSCVTAHSASC